MSETFLHGVQLLEVDTGSRPIRTVRSSVIGLVGNGKDDQIKATFSNGNGTSSLRYSTNLVGADGNSISIKALHPGTANAALSVSLAGKSITINVATSGTSAPVSTAAQVGAALLANPAIASLIYTLPNFLPGNGIYGVHEQIRFSGGVNASFPLDVPVLVTSIRDIDSKLGGGLYLTTALKAIFKQTGAVVVVVRNDTEHDVAELKGVYALKKSQATLGLTPKIILCENSSAYISDCKSVAASLRAVVISGISAGTTATNATAFQAANGNDRTMILWPRVNGGEDPAPYLAGVMALSDNERGFWWSPSNREVFGIESLDSPVDFQMGNTSSLANILNEGKVATFIREGGFRIWGNLTGAIDPKYQFISVRRTADIINDSILTNHLWAVDRNITKTYLEDVSGGVTDYLQTLVNLGAVLGGTCWPDPDLNSQDQISLGKVYFNFNFTPPYPAQTVTFRSILTNDYLTELI